MIYSDFGRDVPTKVTIPDSSVSSCGTSWGTPSKEASLPKIFYDYTERTSLHGIHSSMKKDYSLPRNFIWLLIFMGCTAGFFVAITQQFITYFSYKTTTRVRLIEEPLIEFPAVTICNLNILEKSKIEQEGQFIVELMQTMFPLPDVNLPLNLSDPDVLERTKGVDISAIFNRAKVEVPEMLERCSFNNQRLSCNDYLTPVLTHMGHCYTFNAGRNLSTFRPGVNNGLLFNINVKENEYFTGTYSTGIKVYIHDADEYPVMDQGMIVLAPGEMTYVSIAKQQMTDLPSPYENGHCVENSAATKLKYFKSYSKNACMEECIIKYITNKCNCTDFVRRPDPEYPRCDMYNYIACALPVTTSFFMDAERVSDCACRNPCDVITYEPRLSTAIFPSQYAADQYKQQQDFNTEFVKKNFLEMSIFLDSMMYTLTETLPLYGLSQLGADIGGQMGLFLGASVMTFSEFLEVCLLIVYRLLKKLTSASKVNHVRRIDVNQKV